MLLLQSVYSVMVCFGVPGQQCPGPLRRLQQAVQPNTNSLGLGASIDGDFQGIEQVS